jgi:hypothetical protein
VSSPGPGIPPISSGSPPEHLPPSPPLSPAKRALVAFLMLVGIALAVLQALLWSRGVWNAEVFGYAIGTILMSTIVAYLIAGRRKKRKPVSFGLIFAGILLFTCLPELSNRPEDATRKVTDIVREANGTKPVDRSGAPESPQDKLLREVMTEFLGKVKAYKEKAHELGVGLHTLYAPESFSGPEAMSHTRDNVQKITTLDHEFVLQLEQWPARVQEQVAQSALSESDKQSFLKGVQQTFSNSEIVTLRTQGDQVETQWCKDTLALYDFARSQAARIHVKDAHILVDDEKVRTRFNDLLHQSREQHRRMTETNTQLAKLQQDGLKRLGLTGKDAGLP